MTIWNIGPTLRAPELRYIKQLNGFSTLIRAALAADDIATWQQLVQKRSEAVLAYRRSLEGGSFVAVSEPDR